MSTQKRLELALEQIRPEQWAIFERFASTFLSSEFPGLRTMAGLGGDGGRDSEIYAPEGDTTTVLQYSITPKWEDKIKQTVARLEEYKKEYVQLIYVTNQLVGAKADELKAELRKTKAKILDVRDRSYFLERIHASATCEGAAEEIAKQIVDPFLESKGVITRRAQVLTDAESKAALVFLELQWADDSKDKGLTKTAFDALVRSVLRNSTPENRVELATIYQSVCALLPEHDKEFAANEVDKALRRLDKKFIRSYPDLTYCLTHEEYLRIRDKIVELEVADAELTAEISEAIAIQANGDLADLSEDQAQALCRLAIERFLMERGEQFVNALAKGEMSQLSADALKTIVEAMLTERLGKVRPDGRERNIIFASIRTLLAQPREAVARYLRNLADAYTLRAFLRQTPDIQKAVTKLFSVGEIWLDAAIVLPLLAEGLLPPAYRLFQKLLGSAHKAGLKLRVTPGVIEEVERHINQARVCVNTPAAQWDGTIPYLLSVYVSRGYDRAKFNDFLRNFVGDARPQDDLSEYLEHAFAVVTADIDDDARRADEKLRQEVKETWFAIQKQRRGKNHDELMCLRLAEHDTENFVGVMMRRKDVASSSVGYTSWWLTLDRSAFGVMSKVNRALRTKFVSPVMSADFLENYLAIGPLRDKAATYPEGIPVGIDIVQIEQVRPDLLELADRVREQYADKPELVIRRMVRDALDAARKRAGPITDAGLGY